MANKYESRRGGRVDMWCVVVVVVVAVGTCENRHGNESPWKRVWLSLSVVAVDA